MKISESGAKCWLRWKKGVLVHDKVFAGFPPSRAMRDSATRKLQAAAESILRAPRVLEGRVIWQVPWGISAREWVLRGGWGFLGVPPAGSGISPCAFLRKPSRMDRGVE